VPSGGTITFTIFLLNSGPAPALGVTVSDPLPAGTTFVSCSASQGGCSGPPVGSGGTVEANPGTIPSGGTATLTVVVQAPATSGTLTNVATVSGTNVSGGTLTAGTSVDVGDSPPADIPFLDPRLLAVLALVLGAAGLRALRGS
jgi:uncharacterized repeat protein (TIGR01451 family)